MSQSKAVLPVVLVLQLIGLSVLAQGPWVSNRASAQPSAAVVGLAPTDCDASKFAEAYAVYRRDVVSRWSRMPKDRFFYHDNPSSPRVLTAPGAPFAVEEVVLECAAARGDQLALYFRGLSKVVQGASSEAVVSGWGDLVAAARTRGPGSIEACARLEEPTLAQCEAGLPEAHVALALLSLGCGGIERRDIARFHLQQAIRAKVLNARRLKVPDEGDVVHEHDCGLPILPELSLRR